MLGKNEAIAVLEELRERVKTLKPHSRFAHADFKKWQLDTQSAIENLFSYKPGHTHRFNSICFKPNKDIISTGGNPYQFYFLQGLTEADAVLQSFIGEIQTYWNNNGTLKSVQTVTPNPQECDVVSKDARTVFIVHGRNLKLANAMFTFLRSINLKPLEWSEAVNATDEASPYVGKVLDCAFSAARAVVVLMTPDDMVCLRKPYQSERDEPYEKEFAGQARPNVLFEAGMALGRDERRTVIVQIGKIRPFSDIVGRHIIHFDDSTQRRQELATRLKTSGCDVNLNGTDWHTAGSFVLSEDELNPSDFATNNIQSYK